MLFLNKYQKEELSNHEKLLEEFIEKAPFTLSSPVKKAMSDIEKKQYEKAMIRILDFFEICIPFVSFVFIRLLIGKSKNNRQIHITLENFVHRIDTKRPLSMGDWLNDLFNPLFFAAIQYLSGNELTQSFQENLLEGKQNILSGYKKTRSVVKIRNDYKAHGTSLSEEINKMVVKELEPLFLRMLYALRPLTNCHYNICKGKYEITYNNPNGWAIDLFPFVFVNDKGHRYVFQTLNGEQACFVSSSEDADRLTTYDMNNEIDKDMRIILPSFDISKKLNWEEIKKYLQKVSSDYLNMMKNEEKKYNPELFVERESLTNTLYEFWESNTTLFPLLGSAGQGKTNQLCHWTEKLLAEDKAVIIFNSSDFTDKNIEDALREVFGHRKDVIRMLDDIHLKATDNNQTIYIFFDAINECLKYSETDGKSGPLNLYRDIRRLLCQDRYTNFKTLITCREYTWKDSILPTLADDDPLLFQTGKVGGVVRGFNPEETELAYQIYQQMHQMRSSYQQLDRRVKLRIKDPLVLRFVSENFRNKELSSDPMQFTSLSLFEKTMHDVENLKAGTHQRQILERMADYMLDSYISGVPIDGISYDELLDSFSDTSSELHSLAEIVFLNKNGETTTAFNEVLGSKDRPILRKVSRADTYGQRDYIQFVYERFSEYVMGDALVRIGHNKYTNDQPLPASFYANVLKEGATNVVFVGAIRNALLLDSMRCCNFGTLIDLEKQWGEDYVVLSLVSEVINTMISENYEEEVFSLINKFLDDDDKEKRHYIEAFNKVVLMIESNKADENTMSEYRRLSQLLAPTIRIKKVASVSIINGILLTDYFNEHLYEHDALALLWKIMLDPFDEIRNDACMYAYYLSNRKYTLGFTPLEENLTVRIVKKLYANVKARGLLRNFALKTNRSKTMMFVETATRLCVLMIIDYSRNNDEKSRIIVRDMIDELKGAFNYLSGNLIFLRLFMPIFQIAMKKQITFQSDYVNNAIEYHTSWVQDTFIGNEYQGISWKHADVNELMSFAYHYQRFGHKNDSPECHSEENRFKSVHKKILSAYKTGDSFSLFVLERILVIMGTSRWQNIAPIVDTFFTDEFRRTPWFDYCQMSMLYVLYQVAYHTPEQNDQLLRIYAAEAADWTDRNKGLFRGRQSNRANPIGMYKRNVMCWYAVVYCSHSGDGFSIIGDGRPVPQFYELIDKAIDNNDKELLFHLIENISELITDMGYLKTALQLLKHILLRYNTQEKIDKLDVVKLSRGGLYQYGLVKLVSNVLSTAKNYYAQEVDAFIQKEIVSLSFPGISTYREEVLNYQPSGEKLSDLLTHRFGNFLMWGLLNVKAADDLAVEAILASTRTNGPIAWYKQGVRIFIKHFFNKKL